MPQFTTPDGCAIAYSLLGEGPLIAVTPGGREGGTTVAALADALAIAGFTVLTWDRRNGGASDVFFGGAPLVEAEIWAEDLADLIAHLGRGPAWLAGGSGGCRTSVIAALRRPEQARGLICWSASGGEAAARFLAFQYHAPYIAAAECGGMAAVIETPYWAARIAANPANRARLLAIDPQAFVAIMTRWTEAFALRADAALIGVTDARMATIAMPTLIFAGDDDIHPRTVSDAMTRLIPGAVCVPAPWSREAFADRFARRVAGSVTDLYPALVPTIAAFVAGHR